MKRIVSGPAPLASTATIPDETPLSEISVDKLLDKSLVALQREVSHLLSLSAKGKLDASMARDLRDTVKLLFELKDRESELLKGLTDEHLEAKAKEALDGNK